MTYGRLWNLEVDRAYGCGCVSGRKMQTTLESLSFLRKALSSFSDLGEVSCDNAE
ncbi:hypothetical protein CEB3_c24470 [Peptococcaceae bacterium CEB3]|nr:hypothetical protein CEB3_c24470 [Peptococcaceae bacterium CEB3]